MDLIYSLSIIFAIMSIGFICGARQLFSDVQVEGFELFLFKVGVPCYLFSAVLNTSVTNLINLQYIYSYLLTFIIISCAAAVFLWNTNPIENVLIKSLASGYVNAAIYALPVITFLLGDPESAILGNLIQVIIIQTLFMTILNFIKHRHQSILFRILIVFKNPIVTLPIIAVVLHYNQITPNFLNTTATNLGNGAAGMSLFTFGLILNKVKIKREYISKELLVIVFIKNILHPIIAAFVGSYIFKLDKYWLYSLVIAASAPTAFMVYFIAKQFSIEAKTIRIIVSISSILSLFTLFFIILMFRVSN